MFSLVTKPLRKESGRRGLPTGNGWCAMRTIRSTLRLTRVVATILLLFGAVPSWSGAKYRVLHAFGLGNDGGGVWSSVTLDKAGNVYGTTSGGGTYNGGTVFRLTPGTDGRWKEAILHSFGGGNDGAGPFGGLIFDPHGSLYGTTITGGAHERGVIFELVPGQGRWTENILYNLCGRPGCSDGGDPWGNLMMAPGDRLYGTGFVVFELSPTSGGWVETALHNFTGKHSDGYLPQAGPIRDAAGNLYGTTELGGGSKECDDGCGTVWELSPPAPGSPTGGWTEHILHRFGVGDNLAFPGPGQLAMDPQGNLYGGVLGGKYRAAVIYKLSPVSTTSGADEAWQETVLYNFKGGPDGDFPAGVILDKAGSLYGVCGAGGAYGEGTVFKLSPRSDGTWKFTLLHTFTGYDGFNAVANPTLGPDGKLYGTAESGGPHGGGVVFQLTP